MARFGETAKSERRKAERRVAKLERDINKMSSEREKINTQHMIKSYKTAISEARMFSGGKRTEVTKKEYVHAIERLKELNKEFELKDTVIDMQNSEKRQKRSNYIVGQLISDSMSGRGEYDKFDEVASRAFMRSSQELWQYGDVEHRYNRIMTELGIIDLELIYDAFIDANKDKIEAVRKKVNNEHLSDEEKALLNELKTSDDSQEKKYSKSELAIGTIASIDWVPVTREMIEDYIEKTYVNEDYEDYM